MAEELKYGVVLEDKVSQAAGKASTSIHKLSTELGESKNKLKAYQAQLNLANKLGDISGHQKYGELVSKTQRKVFDLTHEILHSGGAIGEQGKGFLKVVEPIEVARHAVEAFGEGFNTAIDGIKSGDAKGVIEGLTTSLAGLASTLDLVYPGLGQVASAAIKAGGAFAAMTVGVIQAGVEMALEVGAVNERLEATFEALGRTGPESGKKTLEFLNKLSSQLPQSRDQLAKWTQEFQAFGVTDLGELRQQIKATASAQAILGDAGADAYAKVAEKIKDAAEGGHQLKLGKDPLRVLAESGASAAAVADKLGIDVKTLDAQLKAGTIDATKLGNALSNTLIERGKKPLEAMGSELSTLKTKGMETLGHLFDGIDTKPLTDAIQSVISLGDLGRPSGQALHTGIKEGINGVIKVVGKGITELEVLFLTLELYALKSGITMHDVGVAAKVAFLGIKVAAGLAVIALAPLVLEAGALAAPFLAAYYAAVKLYEYLEKKTGVLGGGGKKIAELGTSSLATPHATGGVVQQPAPGEVMASVAPGETILPKNQSPQMSGNALGGVRQMASQGGLFGGGSQSQGGVHIERLDLTVQAAGGVTDATQLSVTGLSLALERFQLSNGR